MFLKHVLQKLVTLVEKIQLFLLTWDPKPWIFLGMLPLTFPSSLILLWNEVEWKHEMDQLKFKYVVL